MSTKMTKNLSPEHGELRRTNIPIEFEYIVCAEETWSLGHLYIFQVLGEGMDMCREYLQQR